MAEKNAMASFLDKIADGLKKNANNDDLTNVLPKPATQDIGDGIIVWRWFPNVADVVIEAVYATRQRNQLGLDKDQYIVSLKMPTSATGTYTLFDDSAKDLGQTLLSAWNWQNIWKLHAGDFLLDVLSKEPPQEFDNIEAESEIVADIIDEDDDAFAINNAQG